jgi:integrase
MNTLRESVQNYLAMRRALGFKLHAAGKALPDFVSFLERREAAFVTTSLALEWAQRSTSVNRSQWAKRLCYVRGFARYRSATDVRTEIPANNLLPHRPKRAQPYLYTDQEIQRLLEAALSLSPERGLRNWTYYCLFGLLFVSGLRVSEAVGLTIENVNLTEGILKVEGTKFGKSRLVPLHPTTTQALADYKIRRDKFLNGCSSRYFFISKTGERLGRSTVGTTFLILSRLVGLRGKQAKNGPRLHDARHLFAIRTLVQWYRSGDDVDRLLPLLSTYLGHVNIDCTYWYLTACPELMGIAVRRLEQRWEAKS